jgi:hypothetical protein
LAAAAVRAAEQDQVVLAVREVVRAVAPVDLALVARAVLAARIYGNPVAAPDLARALELAVEVSDSEREVARVALDPEALAQVVWEQEAEAALAQEAVQVLVVVGRELAVELEPEPVAQALPVLSRLRQADG